MATLRKFALALSLIGLVLAQDTPQPSASETTAATSSPTTTAVQCGGANSANGTIYSDTSSGTNKTFIIECGVDYNTTANELLAYLTVSGPVELLLSSCISLCANTAGCVDLSLTGRACLLKSSITGRNAVPREDDFGGARLLSPLPEVASVQTALAETASAEPASAEAASVEIATTESLTSTIASSTSTLTYSTATTTVHYAPSATPNDPNWILTPLPYAPWMDLPPTSSRTILASSTASPISSAAAAAGAATTCRPDTTPQCPVCNRRFMTIEDPEDSANAYGFRIQCGTEYLGGAMEGGGEGYRGLRGFRFCTEDCAYTPGCVAVAYDYVGGVCSFISTTEGGTQANSSIWGAFSLDY
ncbi:hypothetical protein CB0940_03366 [Cercospora beticola]|uniref:Apple domain-containing protein n=1 Tax=Cercospora beticola TaxID=122368 RepID=A0A2G5I4I8_CERBT|nr:hypothetical protein CB0940_03366 [Cercospora beticola]PIA99403.1 hypothetical protein CB0940_03366 [Cercospora beticola]WPB00542.1 hypothetical protein RHO25_005162 [Cercospora beticola]CAK1361240.1 unnamed protein product [Cercospora beticola]